MKHSGEAKVPSCKDTVVSSFHMHCYSKRLRRKFPWDVSVKSAFSLTLPVLLPFSRMCPAVLPYLAAGGWKEGPCWKLFCTSQACGPPAPVHSKRMDMAWCGLNTSNHVCPSLCLYLCTSPFPSPSVCRQCLSQPTSCARPYCFSCCNTASDITTISVSNSIKTRYWSVSELTWSAAGLVLGVWLAS